MAGGWRDRRAGVALMFAAAVIPITGLIGLAIDLSYAAQAKTAMNAAADAAALAAAKAAADAFTANQPDYIKRGQKAGAEWFKSQSGAVPGAVTSAGSPSISVTQNGAVFTSQVTFKGTVTPFIGPMFGLQSLAISSLSSAMVTTYAYTSVTFLLDNSSSMLIASTQAGVDQLNNLTPPLQSSMSVPAGLAGMRCAFACHWDAGNNDYYGFARKNNIQLRFDVLQTAVASAINQMIGQQKIANQFSVAVYTFASALKQVYATSNDLSGGLSAVKGITTPVVIDAANTDFPTIMRALAGASTQAGDGSVAAAPKKALIIVTDGMADYGARSIPGSKGPIDPASCAGMKALGYNLYVLYTTYISRPRADLLPFDNDGLYDYLNGANPPMTRALQACASAPTNYAEASDPAAIDAAVTSMLQAALGNGGRFVK